MIVNELAHLLDSQLQQSPTDFLSFFCSCLGMDEMIISSFRISWQTWKPFRPGLQRRRRIFLPRPLSRRRDGPLPSRSLPCARCQHSTVAAPISETPPEAAAPPSPACQCTRGHQSAGHLLDCGSAPRTKSECLQRSFTFGPGSAKITAA